MQKENVIVIFGGKSTEHDISIITGLQVFANIDREKFNAIPVYISRKGEMFTGNKLGKIETYVNFTSNDKQIKKVAFASGSDYLLASKNHVDKTKFKPFLKVDCAVICCHGVNGEDGTLQGLLELSNIPFSSSNVLSSAISMDKIIMKDVFVANNIETAKYKYFYKIDYKLESKKILDELEQNLQYPMFVKPANLGSSIGISKCKNREELDNAIEIASNYDNRILVEESIEDNIEVNCAVLGNTDYQIASKIEYPKSWSDFLSFDEKYIQRNKSSKTEVKPEIKKSTKSKQSVSTEIEEKVKEIAKNAFKIFNCSGVVRIDFLIEKKSGKIYLNELNSIPGSLAFYLFKEQGYTFKTMLSRLIDIAKKEKSKKNSNKFLYESTALANFGSGSKINK
jgi:D-alanine-D-alanine ligase